MSSADRSLVISRSVCVLSLGTLRHAFNAQRVAGGSTIVCLFEKNVVEWDEDLLINGRAALETLVRVGMGIGRLRGSPAPLVDVGRNGSG